MGMMYGVQTFKRQGRLLVAEQPVTDRDRDLMLRKGERLAKEKAGVIVYAVETDDDIGDVEEPQIIARHGDLPPGMGDLPL